FHGAARLAGVEERAVDEVLDCRLERRIGTHISRVFSAELEAQADEAACRGSLHRMPARHGPGEGDERNPRIRYKPRGLLVIQVQELEYALGKPGGAKGLGVTLG